jgi:hypothetical protein
MEPMKRKERERIASIVYSRVCVIHYEIMQSNFLPISNPCPPIGINNCHNCPVVKCLDEIYWYPFSSIVRLLWQLPRQLVSRALTPVFSLFLVLQSLVQVSRNPNPKIQAASGLAPIFVYVFQLAEYARHDACYKHSKL